MRFDLPRWLAGLALLVVVATSSSAHAQTGTLPNSGVITFLKELFFEVKNPATDGGTVAQQPYQQPTSSYYYFNYAHCVCDEPGIHQNRSTTPITTYPNHQEDTFQYELTLTESAAITNPLEVWVGTSCDTLTGTPTLGSNCFEISGGTTGSGESPSGSFSPAATVQDLEPSGANVQVGVYDLVTPELSNRDLGTCVQRNLEGFLWVAVDTQGSGVADFWQPQEIDSDTLPPQTPTSFTAAGGDSAIVLEWTAPSDTSDIYYYQALCSIVAADGTAEQPALASPSEGALYQTPRTLCGVDEDPTYTKANVTNSDGGIDASTALLAVDAAPDAGVADAGVIDAGTPDAGVTFNNPLPTGLAQLDPSFICGTHVGQTATQMRIDGLTNGSNYRVSLLVIDMSGNPTPVGFDQIFTPVPSTDFWNDIHNRGDDIQGGFCLINDTFGDDSWIANDMRGFRDDTLASTAFGRWLTAVYYDQLAPLGEASRASWTYRIDAATWLAPVIAVGVLWHHLTLPGLLALIAFGWLARNRRRLLARRAARAATAAAAGIALFFVLAPARAHAQTPYWEQSDATTSSTSPTTATDFSDVTTDQDSTSNTPDTTAVRWIAGVRVGPYTPQIDSGLGYKTGANGPYHVMFGGYNLTPMIDVDRVLWSSSIGQLTVGGSMGYLGKSANSFLLNKDGTTNYGARSPVDTNTFRLIPLSAVVGYRLTYLDDEWGIPVVPYVRGGFAYDIWWSDGPDMSVAQICSGAGNTNCSNSAEGGLLGLTASVGLEIRAERIDANAAATMRDSGIQHAGFYAELSLSKVNDFGESNRLSVGDNTFFLGANFEF